MADKVDIKHLEFAQAAAEEGQAATDQYGHSLVEFDPAAERRLRWKIDLVITPIICLLYLFCFIDRANIGNAALAGLKQDLSLEGYDYNVLLTVFYISYIIFEIPCNMACKLIGPGWFLPFLALCFGICSIGTAFVHSLGAACGVRFLLGKTLDQVCPLFDRSRSVRSGHAAWNRLLLFQVVSQRRAGISTVTCKCRRFPNAKSLTSQYITMAPLGGAFGGLLASAILKLSHFGGLHRWRMIFAIEGIITCGIALVAFAVLTDRPETARWLSEEEKKLAVARVKSERVGTTEVLDKLDVPKTLKGIFSPVTLLTGFIFLLNNITVQGMSFFLPTIVRSIYPDSTVISQQLRSAPPYVVGAFFTLMFPFLSWRFDRRVIFFIASSPLMIAGYAMFLGSIDSNVRYGATFLVASGAFAFGALCNAHVSANVVSDTARSAAIGTNVMIGNIGGMISTWSYLDRDAPNYHIGNGLNCASATLTLICSVLLLLWMKYDNKKRDGRDVDSQLVGLSTKQVQDLDWKHPGFRWRP
ncbi:putative MFS transporter [Phyllosticta citribraziliensis]|uniref:MFS transporter n=1 Tax=Phyllosticta citribraziliensis TaxID=989973 RepID=A0ABR1LSS6_9PEZI